MTVELFLCFKVVMFGEFSHEVFLCVPDIYQMLSLSLFQAGPGEERGTLGFD